MENEEKPNYSTQKEELIVPIPPPTTFPTSAHPFPRFLPKPIAFLIIIVFLTAILSGLLITVYNLGKNSASQTSSVPSPTPAVSASPTSALIPSLKPLGNPPAGSVIFPSGLFEKKNFKLTDKIYEHANYPKELTSKPETELTGFKCTSVFEGYSENGPEYEYISGTNVFNQYMAYFANSAARLHDREGSDSVFFCQTQNNDQYIIYGIYGGGGGGKNVTYLGKIGLDNKISEIANIPNDGAPYFGCDKILIIEGQNIYLECGGGDVGSVMVIYALNLENKNKSKVFECGMQPFADEKDRTKIDCSDGQTFWVN